jgi:thioredoxin:protein disulfide reductase
MQMKNWIRAFAGMAVGLASVAFAAAPFGSKQPEFLPVDQAFELQPLVWRDDGSLEVSWRIAKDYYLYRDRLKFTAAAPHAASLGKPVLPASVAHEDEHFGTTQVYRDKLVVVLPFAKAARGEVKLSVVYQGCADAGLCYPPQTRALDAQRSHD